MIQTAVEAIPLPTAPTTGVTEAEARFLSGTTSLYRRSLVPEQPWARLVVLHGYGDHSGRFLEFLRWMAGNGVATHALDFRGQGRSAGRRGFVNTWSDYLDDLRQLLAEPEVTAAADTPLFVLGHSHGALVLSAAVQRGLVDCTGCILSAPYFATRFQVPPHKERLAFALHRTLPWLPVPNGLKGEWMSSDEGMLRESQVDPYVVRIATPRWYVGCLQAQAEVRARAADFRLPLLSLIAGADPVADPEVARAFHAGIGATDQELVEFPEFRHEILREARRTEVFARVLEWMRARTATVAA
jgi:alpha-beta hydrolase superfamily lysophospholipase